MTTTADDRAQMTELVHDMAEAARQAPSVHNTQPWHFRALPDGLAVLDDPDRSLPVLDPRGRLRRISCGAAALNAAAAVAGRGRRPRVDLVPAADDPTLLAVVRAGERRPATTDDQRDLAAVTRRRTHRRLHDRESVPDAVLDDLRAAVRREGARLAVADAAARRVLAHLLARAVHEQAGDPAVVDEIDDWVRYRGSYPGALDGVPVESLGTAPYPVDSLVGEHTIGVKVADVAEALATSTVVAVSTRGDSVRDWLVAGMALQRLWLRATAAGYVATFADQATQQRSTRGELADVLDSVGAVQVVLRLGSPLVDVPVTPRRPIGELLR